MTPQPRALDRFLSLASARVVAAAQGEARAPAQRVADLLAQPATPSTPLRSCDPPVRRHVAAACALTEAPLASAFLELEPEVPWQLRNPPNPGPGFADGHASGRILGPDGLEQRGGLVAGFSLVAPGMTYPPHNHPPEEIYLVLSGGEWWQDGGAWHAPGPGGIVHNPPGILHAMRGTSVPLLAIWFLLPG